MEKKQKVKTMIISTLLVVVGLFVNYLFYSNIQQNDITVESNIINYDDSSAATNDLQHIIHESQKSIVQINVDTKETSRVGSGFLYNTRGDIITNAHVIDGAKTINVTMSNTETYPAAIVGVGENQDIAVIRVPQLINQKPIPLETSEKLLPGAEIIAVGSPLGFQNSVNIGIISGIDRSFDIDDYNYTDVYQISANITHGNSGGPLIDRRTGKVVGINSAGIEDSDIGFSIPISAIIDDVTEWSSSISNEELTFPSAISGPKRDQEVFLEDATYLVQYFIESLAIHDYINAYTLLGNNLQSQTDYPSFRSEYLQLRDIILINYQDKQIAEDNALLHVEIEYNHSTDNEKMEKTNYLFTIGYENDQVKILDYHPE
ncbi:S1C family serine protease [Amphibacillus cookii]|uniref:S1C family serine protease n=1 Tax=Amphibacillus cookii TaxID=767787 RepID=UPI00195C6DCD|nr:trypsin-like peptidase domain-containing protein [Amphibacillus cookii]MBM7540405.1 hypothetical protein [Amphibacillus cookii]